MVTPSCIGVENEGTATTTIARTAAGSAPAVLIVNKSDDGGAALALDAWYGGYALQANVYGTSQTAIRAYSDIGTAISAQGDIDTAVEAIGRRAVWAEGTEFGVYAEVPHGHLGTAVKAVSTDLDGYALHTSGRISFGLASGVATIAAGKRSVTVTPSVKISTGTKVMTTLQSSAGGTIVVHRISRNTTANSFTIYLTATAIQRCYVAWLLIG